MGLPKGTIMEQEQIVPLYSEDLIKRLDRLYPKVNPKPSDTMEQIMFHSGKRSVVDNLLYLLDKQKEDQKMGED
jgi:hypothetical protein